MTAPTEFMLQLHKDLLEKKKVAESTASAYVKALVMLNDKKPLKNLAFLKDTEAILKKIEGNYAQSTQRTILGTIAGVLGTYDDKPAYKKLQKWYSEKLMTKAEEMKGGAEDTNTKTEKQKENWAEWEEVSKLRDELLTKVSQQKEARGKKPLKSADEYDDLLHLFVLSLYTYIQPRRNRDYMDMVFWNESKKTPVESAPTDKNYLVVEKKEPIKFIYNVYKTAKTYGKQTAEIPKELADVIKMYMGVKSVNTANDTPILQDFDGTPFKAINTITRILNKVFDKKVGSSMLRHSFLSSKDRKSVV
jgi:hypothetical protein